MPGPHAGIQPLTSERQAQEPWDSLPSVAFTHKYLGTRNPGAFPASHAHYHARFQGSSPARFSTITAARPAPLKVHAPGAGHTVLRHNAQYTLLPAQVCHYPLVCVREATALGSCWYPRQLPTAHGVALGSCLWRSDGSWPPMVQQLGTAARGEAASCSYPWRRLLMACCQVPGRTQRPAVQAQQQAGLVM